MIDTAHSVGIRDLCTIAGQLQALDADGTAGDPGVLLVCIQARILLMNRAAKVESVV